MILASTTLTPRLADQCERSGVPVLLINRVSTWPGMSTIVGENRRGGETIARFLLAAGHKRPAFIAGLETTSTSRDREEGFLGELARNGVALTGREVGNHVTADAAEATRRLINQDVRPDAIFVANDFMAISVITTLQREFGLRVPEDVSIIGFDAVEDVAHAGYELTTFSQPVRGFVEHVAAQLDALIKEPNTHTHQQVSGELIVGKTARLPPFGVAEQNGRRVWRP